MLGSLFVCALSAVLVDSRARRLVTFIALKKEEPVSEKTSARSKPAKPYANSKTEYCDPPNWSTGLRDSGLPMH